MRSRNIKEILEKNEENEKLSNYLKKEEKRNHAGITLVSLVVTIIVLILLAGTSINLILGNEGIFTIAQKAKENMELAQIEEQEKLNSLYTQLDFNTEGEGATGGSGLYDAITERDDLKNELETLKEKFNIFKKDIADAIKDAGGTPLQNPIDAKTETFQTNIKGIVAKVTDDATATPEDILEGKTAWVKGNKITGTNTLSQSNVIKKHLFHNGVYSDTYTATNSKVLNPLYQNSFIHASAATIAKPAIKFNTPINSGVYKKLIIRRIIVNNKNAELYVSIGTTVGGKEIKQVSLLDADTNPDNDWTMVEVDLSDCNQAFYITIESNITNGDNLTTYIWEIGLS